MAEVVINEEQIARKKRVLRLKKWILIGLAIGLILPTILCVILFIYMNQMSHEIQRLSTLIETKNAQAEEVVMQSSGFIMEPGVTFSQKEENESVTPQQGSARRVYLTFDDGPSIYTNDILDILKEYDVKATFFVVGKTDEASIDSYKRIVEEGHTLGMHSYSHRYNEIYKDMNSFKRDFAQLQEYLYDVTGTWSRFYRFPGGSSNSVSIVDMTELITYLNEQDITYFDWNISSGDASGGYISAKDIFKNCTADLEYYNTAVVLLHDASTKKSTVEALPMILDYILQMDDTEVLPITDDTIPIQHIESNIDKGMEEQ